MCLNSKHVWLESKLYGLVYYLLNPLRPLWDIRQQNSLSIYPYFGRHVVPHPKWVLRHWGPPRQFGAKWFRPIRFPFVAWRHRKATVGIRDCFILSSWPSHRIRLRFLSMITLWQPVFLLSSLFEILLGQKMGQIFPSPLCLLVRLPRYVVNKPKRFTTSRDWCRFGSIDTYYLSLGS